MVFTMLLITSALGKPPNRFAFPLLCNERISTKRRGLYPPQRVFESTSFEDNNSEKINGKNLPPEPQDCCMSGCANCVWIKYAEDLSKILNDGGQAAKEQLLKHVKDPNLRAFLMIELEDLFKKKN